MFPIHLLTEGRVIARISRTPSATICANHDLGVCIDGQYQAFAVVQTICYKIYGHIKEEYGRNIDRKKELVEQAKSLIELEDFREAIDRAKGIQREWKDVGLTLRQLDRRSWKEFRGD